MAYSESDFEALREEQRRVVSSIYYSNRPRVDITGFSKKRKKRRRKNKTPGPLGRPLQLARGEKPPTQRKLEKAARMFRNPTPGEIIADDWFRRWFTPQGFPFERQVPKFGYIADFFCQRLSLVVEIDGGIHAVRRDRDEKRDVVLAEHGVYTLRFTNAQITDRPQEVREAIQRWIDRKSRVASQQQVRRDERRGDSYGSTSAGRNGGERGALIHPDGASKSRAPKDGTQPPGAGGVAAGMAATT